MTGEKVLQLNFNNLIKTTTKPKTQKRVQIKRMRESINSLSTYQSCFSESKSLHSFCRKHCKVPRTMYVFFGWTEEKNVYLNFLIISDIFFRHWSHCVLDFWPSNWLMSWSITTEQPYPTVHKIMQLVTSLRVLKSSFFMATTKLAIKLQNDYTIVVYT